MDFQVNHQHRGGVGGAGSLFNSSSDHQVNHSSSSSSPISTITNHHHHQTNNDPMQSWWESVSKARSRIHSLLSLLPPESDSEHPLASLADSDRPARSLLESPAAYAAVSSALSSPLSGSGSDPLCQWLYDTFQSSDPDLRLVVLSFLPLLSGLYLSRLHSPAPPPLSGFEAVLLALYSSQAKSRSGKPLLISIPDLSLPSLYHNPSPVSSSPNHSSASVGVLSPPLEPQLAIKSTKRACIVGVALHFYYTHISHMPNCSKIDLCRFAASWAGPHCPCARSLDPHHLHHDFDHDLDQEDALSCTAFDNGEIHNVADHFARLDIQSDSPSKGSSSRVPLPWEMLQPVLRIIGHCLLAPLISQEIRDEAAVAVRRLYARASHDLFPQGILATRSLIRLDNQARAAVDASALVNSASNVNTPSKSRRPEVLLVSK